MRGIENELELMKELQELRELKKRLLEATGPKGRASIHVAVVGKTYCYFSRVRAYFRRSQACVGYVGRARSIRARRLPPQFSMARTALFQDI